MRNFIHITIVFLATFITGNLFAAVTILSVSGNSRYMQSENTILGGLAGADSMSGNCSVATTGTVNTCTGIPSAFAPCNQTAVCPQTQLTISFRSDSTSGTARITTYDDNNITNATSAPGYISNSNVTLTVPWGNLCQSITSIGATGSYCNSGTGRIKVGIDSNNDGTLDDLVTLTITTSTITANSGTNSVSTGGLGVVDYTLKPGDGRVYLLDDYTIDGNTIPDGNEVAGLALYLVEGALPTAACGQAGLLSNISSFYELDVDSDKNLLSNKAEDGIINEVRYVSTIALIDTAGNIGNFFETNGVCQEDKHTVKPRAVYGLLEDNVNCFISTAAYGSPFHSKVSLFREFRDKVLRNYSLGEDFIEFYYKYSPVAANVIAENDFLRTLTRGLLYPLWIFSTLSLQIGLGGAFAVALLSMIMSFMLIKIVTRKISKKSFSIFVLIITISSVSNAQDDFFDLSEESTSASEYQPDTPPAEPPYTGNEIEEIENAPSDNSTPMVGSGFEEDLQTPAPTPNKWREGRRVPEEERLKELADEEGLFRITAKGEYLYDVKKSPQESAASLRAAIVSFPNLINPDSGVHFDEIYGEDDKIMLLADYEWQFFKSFGKLGIKLATGAMFANGNGRFIEAWTNPNTGDPEFDAEEDYLFIMFPNTASLVYRLQIYDNQWLVPFGEIGISYFTFLESVELGEDIKFGGAPHLNFAVGGSFLLDILGRDLILNLDRDYGINHMWLTAEYRRFESLGATFDFSGDIFSAGIMVEF